MASSPGPTYPYLMRLLGKVGLVTGAALGMGREVALAFAREGSAVVLADINEEAGKQTTKDIENAGGKALFVRTDVSRSSEVESVVKQTLEHFGKLDILFANAAVQLHGQDAKAHELDEEIWERTIAINLKGVWLSCKYAIAAMLADGGGQKSVILACSPTGLTGAPGYTAYSASKGGIAALTRTIAADYGRQGIRVNAVVPGPMETPLTAELFADPKVRGSLEAATILGRIGRADEITGLAVFLASDEATYCTGGLYMADGGITAL
mgnify:CR=1 FL=1